jgi:hypothetical protein
MTDHIEEFFTGLGLRGYEPLLRHNGGSIGFDLRGGGVTDHWTVFIDQGKLNVQHEDVAADTTLTVDRSIMADVIVGKQNVLNVLLLGQAGIRGDAEKLVSFQRLFGNRPQMATSQTGQR